MNVPRSLVIAGVLALLILGGCVLISTLAINQFRNDRAYLLEHCTLHP
jgi:hypothetical protein